MTLGELHDRLNQLANTDPELLELDCVSSDFVTDDSIINAILSEGIALPEPPKDFPLQREALWDYLHIARTDEKRNLVEGLIRFLDDLAIYYAHQEVSPC